MIYATIAAAAALHVASLAWLNFSGTIIVFWGAILLQRYRVSTNLINETAMRQSSGRVRRVFRMPSGTSVFREYPEKSVEYTRLRCFGRCRPVPAINFYEPRVEVEFYGRRNRAFIVDQFHRRNGPAIIETTPVAHHHMWARNGRAHRADGPALVASRRDVLQWWHNGSRVATIDTPLVG